MSTEDAMVQQIMVEPQDLSEAIMAVKVEAWLSDTAKAITDDYLKQAMGGGGMSDHATVTRDGYEVPLIGVPMRAVEDECQCCGDILLMRVMEVTDGGVLCPKCRKDVRES